MCSISLIEVLRTNNFDQQTVGAVGKGELQDRLDLLEDILNSPCNFYTDAKGVQQLNTEDCKLSEVRFFTPFQGRSEVFVA